MSLLKKIVKLDSWVFRQTTKIIGPGGLFKEYKGVDIVWFVHLQTLESGQQGHTQNYTLKKRTLDYFYKTVAGTYATQ